jgi:hypothetical protein
MSAGEKIARFDIMKFWLCVLSSTQLTGCASPSMSECLVLLTPPLREAKGWVPRACTAHSHDSNCTNVSSNRVRVATPPWSSSHVTHARWTCVVCGLVVHSNPCKIGTRSSALDDGQHLWQCVWVCVLPHTRRLHRHSVSTMPSFQVHSIDCGYLQGWWVVVAQSGRGEWPNPFFSSACAHSIFQLM